jgi:hypothetical protein
LRAAAAQLQTLVAHDRKLAYLDHAFGKPAWYKENFGELVYQPDGVTPIEPLSVLAAKEHKLFMTLVGDRNAADLADLTEADRRLVAQSNDRAHQREHARRIVFKKLTDELLEMCERKCDSFISCAVADATRLFLLSRQEVLMAAQAAHESLGGEAAHAQAAQAVQAAPPLFAPTLELFSTLVREHVDRAITSHLAELNEQHVMKLHREWVEREQRAWRENTNWHLQRAYNAEFPADMLGWR